MENKDRSPPLYSTVGSSQPKENPHQQQGITGNKQTQASTPFKLVVPQEGYQTVTNRRSVRIQNRKRSQEPSSATPVVEIPPWENFNVSSSTPQEK